MHSSNGIEWPFADARFAVASECNLVDSTVPEYRKRVLPVKLYFGTFVLLHSGGHFRRIVHMEAITMTYFESSEPTKKAMLDDLMKRWQVAANEEYVRRYGADLKCFADRDSTRYSVGAQFAHFCIGSSSAFLVDLTSGIIYGNKGWLKRDKNKIVGNAYDPNFDAAVLVRDRFRYGRFVNNADGSIPMGAQVKR